MTMASQEQFNLMMKGLKQKEFADKPIRTLGEIILLLKAQPPDNIVKLDFCGDNPYGVGSYRGYYEDLALEYSLNKPEIKVANLLKEFEFAVGRTFEGYKGGDFIMDTKTLVWVAQYGDCGRMLINITSKDNVTIIHTQLYKDLADDNE